MNWFVMSMVAVLTVFPVQPLFAETSAVTGVFSTFRWSERSGDLVGVEIHIVPNPVGYSAIVQGSEGAPGFPEVVSVTVKATSIEFVIPQESGSGLPPGKYNGTITKEGLRLDGPAGHYKNVLIPRAASFWH
jgi:hypothetical protein